MTFLRELNVGEFMANSSQDFFKHGENSETNKPSTKALISSVFSTLLDHTRTLLWFPLKNTEYRTKCNDE